MKKWPLRIIRYLTGTLLLSVLHCVVVGIVAGGDIKTFLYSIIYLPVIILLSEGQKQSKYFCQFAIVSIITIGMVRIVYGNIVDSFFEQTLATVLTMAAVSIYFYARAKKAECLLESPDYHFLALFLIIWFLERQYPSALLEKYAVAGAGFYCLLCMYKMNLDEIMQIIDLNGNLERFPEKRLLKNNLLMMGFQTIIVGIGMGIFMSTDADSAFNKLAEVFRRFARWILSFLESDVKPAGSEVSGNDAIMPVAEAAEQSAFLEILMKIMDALSWVLVIGLVLFVVYKIAKKFYQLYLEFDMNSAENGDEIEKIYTVQSKEEKRQIKKQQTENLRWNRTPNARIRKHYKRRVLRELNETPKSFMTPEEIEAGISMEEEEKDNFHRIYEKARYGNVSCTKEEMENFIKI